MTDIVKTHPNERLDIADVDFSNRALVDELQRLTKNLVTGDGTTFARVLDGFTFVISTNTVLTIALGKALAGEIKDGIARFGQHLSEGLTSQSVSFAGKAVATHGVWIRFTYADGTKDNRAFWDEGAVAEEVQLVDTRQIAGWSVTVSVTSPGAEWMQIYAVAYDGADLHTSVITDKRNFLFEGPSDSSPAFSPAWGTGLDRNNDRATNGVKTLSRFAAAVLKKIEEIQSGTARWWTATVEPLDKKVSRLGDLTLVGDYVISGGDLDLTSGNLDIGGNTTLEGDVEIGGTLKADSLATFKQGLDVTATDTSTADPDPDSNATRPLAIIENLASTVNARASLFFLQGGADAARDGYVLYSQRVGTGDANVELRIASILDSAFGAYFMRIAANGVEITPLLTCLDNVSADNFIPTSDPVAAVFQSGVTGRIVMAEGYVSFDGAGGATLDGGHNVAGVAVITDASGNKDLEVTVAGAGAILTGSNKASIQHNVGAPTADARFFTCELIARRTANKFTIQVIDQAGTRIDLSTTATLVINFSVTGRWFS